MWLALAVWVLDVALFSTAGSNLSEVGPGNISPLGLIGYAGLGAAALIWRRRSPMLVFWIVWAHATVGAILVSGYQPVLSLLVMVYTIGAHRPREQAWIIAPALLPALVASVNEATRPEQTRPVPTFLGLLAFFALTTGGVWALGYWTAVSRRRLAESQRLRKIEAELAVAQERARISRELHDIVAHTVTVMVLQAAGAQKILPKNPDRAEQALGQIAELGRAAMNELRRMLAVQRLGDEHPAQQPGLADLGELFDRVRGGGVAVSFSEEGPPQRLDPSVALAVYRIVQEALTNTAKHAGPEASARVRLVWGDELLVEVTDAGAAAVPALSAALSTGNGLLGLRERVGVVGGRLDSGPREEGGYRLAAVLPGGGMIRVLLADDQPLVRAGIAMLLAAEDDMEVVAECGDGREAVDRALALEPDVVLMDVRMPGLSGVEATAKLAGHTRVLILTTYHVDDAVYGALRSGASGFLLKDAVPAELVMAIRAVAAGEAWLDPAVAQGLLADFAARPEPVAAPAAMRALTGREREVLALAARGLSNEEIAATLVIGEATVKTHLGRVLMKLGVRDRTQAVVAAYQSGLVRP